MGEDRQGHVSDRFERLLALYRRPDGSEWGGQDLERVTGGVVQRSYVTNLRKGRIGSPGLDKLEAIAKAMGFPPAMWFDPFDSKDEDSGHRALMDALKDENTRALLAVAVRLGEKDRHLMLGIARQIASFSEDQVKDGGG